MVGSRPRRGAYVRQRNDRQRLIAGSEGTLLWVHSAEAGIHLPRPLTAAVIGHKHGEASLHWISQDHAETCSIELQRIPKPIRIGIREHKTPGAAAVMRGIQLGFDARAA